VFQLLALDAGRRYRAWGRSDAFDAAVDGVVAEPGSIDLRAGG
jgi:hypothetical protein